MQMTCDKHMQRHRPRRFEEERIARKKSLEDASLMCGTNLIKPDRQSRVGIMYLHVHQARLAHNIKDSNAIRENFAMLTVGVDMQIRSSKIKL